MTEGRGGGVNGSVDSVVGPALGLASLGHSVVDVCCWSKADEVLMMYSGRKDAKGLMPRQSGGSMGGL